LVCAESRYIVNESNKTCVVNAIVECKAKNSRHEKALRKAWMEKDTSSIVVEISNRKTMYAPLIGKAIVKDGVIPSSMVRLLTLVRSGIGA